MSSLGITHVTVQVLDLAKQGTPYQDEFLVDTGSIDCLAPADRLEAVGIQREGKKSYELANGQPVEFEYGFARISFLGDHTVAPIIFGPEKAEPILGVIALESVGVIVDPVTRELRRLHATPLKGSSRSLEMITVILSGWKPGDPGLNKVELTKLIRNSNGLGLAEAKAQVHRLVGGEDVELVFSDREAAESFSDSAIALGAQIRTGSVR